MTGPARLTVAGVATVGSAYGMARYGFGLLLPDMRAAMRLSVAAIGATAAAGYAAYLAVSLCTGALVARYGPRATVVAAAASRWPACCLPQPRRPPRFWPPPWPSPVRAPLWSSPRSPTRSPTSSPRRAGHARSAESPRAPAPAPGWRWLPRWR